jgi:hypothetical protein
LPVAAIFAVTAFGAALVAPVGARAQRADLVAIKAMKPFAAIVYAQPPTGTPPLTVLESGLAQAKILVMGYAATAREAQAQEPYRWTASDSQAGALNSAEVLGKQLAGKKAQFGGDDVKNQTRKFGVIYDPDATDYSSFTNTLAKYKGKVTTPIEFSSTTPAAEVGTLAASAVTKMKAAGVTTVLNFKCTLQGRDGCGGQAGVDPRVVLQRQRLRRPRHPCPRVSGHSGAARVRHLGDPGDRSS